ncbi:MICOS complex subunit mic25a-like isoform X2 [Anabas testudineus]|uniref:MICOS complex subunit mic25a-like isoform X2 n=1 Tax=Anabas testudineus TaxID=64144 RepID=UPI000E45A858|nr:MICOS complex subunit mic25a-like isoform X2 [Anabas testudineus]
MGANGSTTRNVSFGLDEDEKVTVVEGVKLSEHVLRRMRESQGSDSAKPPLSSLDKPPSQKPTGPSTTEIQEELRKDFERQQALVQEQLASLAQMERETAATTGLDELTPALMVEKGKVFEEQEKSKILPADLDAWVSNTTIADPSSFLTKRGCECAATTIPHNNTLGGIQLENYTSSVLLVELGSVDILKRFTSS